MYYFKLTLRKLNFKANIISIFTECYYIPSYTLTVMSDNNHMLESATKE